MPQIPLRAAPLLAGAVLLIAAPGALAAKRTANVSVMTRNLFLGADLPPLALAQPGSDFEAKAGAILAEQGPVFVCLKIVSSGDQERDYSRLHGPHVRKAFKDALSAN